VGQQQICFCQNDMAISEGGSAEGAAFADADPAAVDVAVKGGPGRGAL
jgi:hypothetical protein